MALFPRLKPPPSAPKIGLNPPNLIFGGVGTLWADTGGGGWSKRRRRRRSISQGVRATGSPAPLATQGDGPKESSGCSSTSWLLSVQRWEETDRAGGGQETEGPSRTLMERRWSVDSGGNSRTRVTPTAHAALRARASEHFAYQRPEMQLYQRAVSQKHSAVKNHFHTQVNR